MIFDLILKILLIIIVIRLLIVDTKRLRAELETKEMIEKLKAEFDEKTKDLEM